MVFSLKAAEYFREEGVRNGSAAKCLLKTADYVAMEGEYRRAIDIYEQIGMSRADHHLLKWGAKDIYFKVTQYAIDETYLLTLS